MGYVSSPRPRDVLTDAETACASSSNTNTSCYPVALTKFVQGEDASFIWNPTLSQFRRTNLVNITIYDGTDDSDIATGMENIILRYTNLENPETGAGTLKVPVNDSWWGDKGAIWVGNISYAFFWTIWETTPDSILATMVPTPPPSASASVSAGSITGGSASAPVASNSSSVPPPSSPSSNASHRTAIIAGVVASVLGLALLLSLLFLLRRRRLARNSAQPNTRPDPLLDPGVYYEKQPLKPQPSKVALDLEMRTAHQRLEALRHELQTQPGGGPADSRVENAELRAQIQMLTEEVERLRCMGAEAPPAYSMQDHTNL
ncbi:hypothetical protein B0H19DRAFT_1268200 [Mycena capillaripes]|nr:hypothetical protein B0H19DRAFT_1268200 [Mycena capillaripes]